VAVDEPDELDEADEIEDAVFSALDRPLTTVALVGTMLSIHIWIGAIMWLRGWVGPLGLLASSRPTPLLTRWGAMRDVKLDAGELWRLVSCVFLHGDGLHMLLNGLALFALGRLCEALYGPARFLWLFLVAGVCGASFSWLGGNSTSVGASGGIFGLMGAAMVFGWRYRHRLPEPMSYFLRRSLLPWVVLNLAIGLFIPFIDNLGHIGGLIGGTLLAMVIGNRVVPGEQSPLLLRAAMATASAGLMAAAAAGVASKWGLL
jgi:rhomboid protease GluP